MRWKTSVALLCSVLAIALIVLVFLSRRTAAPRYQRLAAPSKIIVGIAQLRGYKKWRRVNPKPEYLNPNLAALCSIPSPAQRAAMSDDNPHLRKFFTVYVNAIGAKTMMTQAHPKFPVGTIIVKEKLARKTDKTPELLTVMLKRERGYDAAGGDWEYLVVNGAVTKIEGRGLLKNCRSCHAFNQETDFVFRSYLDAETAKKLK